MNPQQLQEGMNLQKHKALMLKKIEDLAIIKEVIERGGDFTISIYKNGTTHNINGYLSENTTNKINEKFSDFVSNVESFLEKEIKLADKQFEKL